MKAKQIAIASLIAISAASAEAVPAYPGMIGVRQTDGAELSIRRIGDEFYNLSVTSDGYPLVYNTVTGNYEYASYRDGRLVSEGIAAAAPESRDSAALKFLASIDMEREMKAFSASWDAARRKADGVRESIDGNPHKVVRISDVPTLGQHDVLVILVDFSDISFSDNAGTPDPSGYYDRFFHEEGFSDFGATGSAHDYYYHGSCGLYDPRFRVFGPVKLNGTHADYAGDGGTKLTDRLIEEAVRLANEQYDVNFKDFDTDGDGKVDNVYCIYAGYGQADSDVSDAIWPHSYELHKKNAQFDIDGVTIDRYTVSQQLNGQSHNPVGIGTFVHEFGHVLGFADHYNTASSMGNAPNNVGEWDVMSHGSYNNDQNTPPELSAFERYSLGWTEPTVLPRYYDKVVEMTSYADSGLCYRVDVKAGDKEYFLIENRQREGWDRYVPGHGVLVWHIEENQIVWDANKTNYDPTHQMVDIVEAANILTSSGASSDAFPGSENVTSYQFKDWDGNSVFGFDWVEEDNDGKCRFLLSNTGYKIPAPVIQVDNLMGTSASLFIESEGPAYRHEVAVLKDNEEVYFVNIEETQEIPLSELEPETEYRVRARSFLTTLSSDNSEIRFTTLPLQIEEKKPQILRTSDETPTGFTAHWKAMEEAVDYSVEIYTTIHDGEGLLNYGFDDFSTSSQNLPEGWTLTARQSRYENDFGEKAPSLRLRDEGAVLMMAVPDNKIDKLDFWFMPGKAGMVLALEKCIDGEWSKVWEHIADRKKEYRVSVETEHADSLRLVFTRQEGVTGGYVLIDDINLHYVYDRFTPYVTAVIGPSYDEGFTVDENGICSYEVGNLDPELEYAYSVQALSGTRRSIKSDILRVGEEVNVSVDEMALPKTEDMTIYNLQGIRMHGEILSLPAGIYIINGKKTLVGR